MPDAAARGSAVLDAGFVGFYQSALAEIRAQGLNTEGLYQYTMRLYALFSHLTHSFRQPKSSLEVSKFYKMKLPVEGNSLDIAFALRSLLSKQKAPLIPAEVYSKVVAAGGTCAIAV